MRRGALTRTIIGLALVFGVVILRSESAHAGGFTSSAEFQIHKAECFHGVGSEIFEKCHDNALAGVYFAIGSGSDTTNVDGRTDGTISFNGDSVDVTITEDPDTFALYLGAYVYCSDQNDGTVLYDDSADTGSVTITITDGANVICDWYDITPAEDTGGSTGGTTLPNTGVGLTGGANDQALILVLALATIVLGAAVGLRRRDGR